MSSTLLRILIFHLVFGLLATPLYLIFKTGILEFMWIYVPLLSIGLSTYMELQDGRQRNE